MKILLLFAAASLLPLSGSARAAGSSPADSGASALTLAPGLSFTDDSSSNFPIRGENLTSGEIARDRPTVIFFGTSHCYNTNREAERLVDFAARHGEDVRFLIVDLNRPSGSQRALISRFYRGSIPTLTFISASGRVTYNEAGETARRRRDIERLEALLAGAR